MNEVESGSISRIFFTGFEDIRTSRLQMFFKIGLPKYFTGKRLCWSLFLIKFILLKRVNFIKKRLQDRCNFRKICKLVKFLITPFFAEHLRWLLLIYVSLSVIMGQSLSVLVHDT